MSFVVKSVRSRILGNDWVGFGDDPVTGGNDWVG